MEAINWNEAADGFADQIQKDLNKGLEVFDGTRFVSKDTLIRLFLNTPIGIRLADSYIICDSDLERFEVNERYEQLRDEYIRGWCYQAAPSVLAAESKALAEIQS